MSSTTDAHTTPDGTHLDGQDGFEFPGQPDFTVKADPDTQWRAYAVHMANWGGFEGVTRIDASASTTLITGASGAGKSSLLDAYTALMMDYGVRFNGASNDAVSGRARGEDQRNLLSYLRGMTDTKTQAGTGEKVATVLRGDTSATWGAVGVTFRNDHGEYFTALRGCYVPLSATRDSDTVRRIATYHGPIDDFTILEEAGRAGFPKQGLRDALPGVVIHNSYKQFAATLSTALGIGASGNAEKALQLLARVQAGHKVSTVDGLYKDLVIEPPATYEAADSAIAHFNDLEDSYLSMVDDLAKVSLLDPVAAQYATLETRRAEYAALRHLGPDAGPDSPLHEWQLRTEERILDVAEADNADNRRAIADSLRESRTQLAQQKERRDAAIRDHQAAGGGKLDALTSQIDSLTNRLTETQRRRDTFDAGVAVLNAPLAGRDDFTALTIRARAGIDAAAATRAEFKKRREEVMTDQHAPSAERSELRKELASLSRRAGAVPGHLDDLRHQVSAASGIAVTDLPFVAELIDVAPGEERWRIAVEETLGSLARRMLVPEDQLEQFSASIDRLKLRGRLRFDGVTPVPHEPRTGTPGRISSKLVFAASPYSWWAEQRVTSRNDDAECVEHPSDLAGGGYRVTPGGQVRRGRSGAHGQSNTRPIIGFSNEHAISNIEARLAELDQVLSRSDVLLRELDDDEDRENRYQVAYQQVLNTAWDDIDTDGVTTQIDQLRATRDQILSSDTKLNDLEDAVEELRETVSQTERFIWGLEEQGNKYDAEHATLVDRKDAVTAALDSIDRRGVSGLTDEAAALIEEKLAEFATPPTTRDELRAAMVTLREKLRDKTEAVRDAVDAITRDIERTFETYLDRWPDPNLTATIAAHPEFVDILDGLRKAGLYTWHDTWVRNISKWSATDLVPLHAAYASSLETIENRLHPINAILAALPFGAEQDRLRIKMDHRTPDSVTRFRRRLKQLSAIATQDLSDLTEDEVKSTFGAIRAFVAQLRDRKDERAAKDSRPDELLDVRRHIEITAIRYDPETGEEKATYDALGGKSGGESQELVAFIVGAALRYQLGDELRSRPRFAPVLLDEGFVKSDGEFTGRSMAAWRELGFQLIVAAPLDKATSLEPYCDGFLQITKLTGGYSRALPIPAGTERTISLASALAEEEAGSAR